jgi:hypothetical protein
MPLYQMKAPNGRTYRVPGPVGATNDQVRAEILRQHPDAGSPDTSNALGKGFMRGLSNVSDTIVKAAAGLVDQTGISPSEAVAWAAENISGYSKADAAKIARNLKSLPNFQTIVNAGAQSNKMRDMATQQAHPYAYGAGKIGGEVFGTAPIAGLMAKPVRALAGGTRAGQIAATALESSGFKTGMLPTREAVKKGLAEAPALVERLADMAIRGAAGATTGSGVAIASDQNAGLGFLIGALMPTVGSATFRTVTDKVILPLWERISGQLGVQRAAAIFRSALNMTVQEALALAHSAQGNMSFAKTVAQAGKNEPALQALFKTSAEGAGKHIYAPLESAETQAQQDVLNSMAGGSTEREARNALLEQRGTLGEQYAAKEAEALQRANLGGQQIPPLAAASQRLEKEAAAKSALARRMVLGADRAETQLGQMDDLGDQFNPEAINFQRGAAASMGQRGETAAQEAIRLRDAAANAKQQIANLNAQGIHALETQPIVGQIRAMASAEGAGQVQRKALAHIADEIESHGPIIRAGDLDAIRRQANVAIAHLNQGLDVGSVKRYASEVVGRIKPLIDTAIENAGGAGYKEAKAAFATGAKEGERQAFAGDLAHMFETNPTKFADTVRGARGTTGTVEAAFPQGGKRNFDIQEMMGVSGGAQGPSRMPALEHIAKNIDVKNMMAAQAGEGENLAKNLMANPPQELDIFHKLSPIGMATSATMSALKFARILSDAGLNTKIQQSLAEGFRNGKSAAELLLTIPAADRAQVARRLADSGYLSTKASAGISTANQLNTPPPQYSGSWGWDPKTQTAVWEPN